MTELSPTTTATALDIIKGAMEEIRVLRSGETPSAEDIDFCLRKLNNLFDSWSANDLMIFATTTDTLALTAGMTSFTIGDTDGDIDATRPVDIDARSSFVRDSDDNDTYCEPMTEQEYNRLSLKSDGDSIPRYLLYRQTMPLGTVYMYPPASSTAGTLHLVSRKPFSHISVEAINEDIDINTPLNLPPGYLEGLEANLARRIAKGFGKPVDQETVMAAMKFEAGIMSRNLARRPIKADYSDIPTGGRRGSMSKSDFESGNF